MGKITAIEHLRAGAEAAKTFTNGLVSELADATTAAMEELEQAKADKGNYITTESEGEITDPLPEYVTTEYLESLNHVTRTEMLQEIDRQIQGAISASY